MYLNFAEGVHIDGVSDHARTGVSLSPSASLRINSSKDLARVDWRFFGFAIRMAQTDFGDNSLV